MVAIIVGLIFIAFSVFATIGPLHWWVEVLDFLKGSIPVIAFLVGLVAVFIGIADIKDRVEAKKEEAEEKKDAEKASPDKKA
jgi:hypothetical protein